jgi:predicted tellurium resistance membrane protein TerC
VEHLLTLETLFAFLTLSFLEIVLGIDNIIFISILTNKLPEEIRPKARTFGIGLALVFRILMLLSITWIIGLTEPFVHIMGYGINGRDTVLFLGGLFLIQKSTREIYEIVEAGGAQHGQDMKVQTAFTAIIVQIALLDIVFSFDSILTAIGMTQNLPIMIAAIVVAMFVMLKFSGPVAKVIEKHPSLQILALAFLILIGVLLVAESAGYNVPKSYIYAAVGFSLGVEMLNMRGKTRS